MNRPGLIILSQLLRPVGGDFIPYKFGVGHPSDLQVVGKAGVPVEISQLELVAGEIEGLAEVDPAQIGFGEIGVFEVGSVKVGFAQHGAVEIHLTKVGAGGKE